MKSRFTLDPREVNEYVAKLDPRRELLYRLALRGLCDRSRSDDAFTQRTSSRCGSGMISARCCRRPRGSREIWQDTDWPKERPCHLFSIDSVGLPEGRRTALRGRRRLPSQGARVARDG